MHKFNEYFFKKMKVCVLSFSILLTSVNIPQTAVMADVENECTGTHEFVRMEEDSQKHICRVCGKIEDHVISEEGECICGVISIETNANIQIEANNAIYDGTEQTASVTVKNGDTALEEGKDYTVSEEKQTDAGIYKVTVTGIGDYTGMSEVDWEIGKAVPTFTVPTGLKLAADATLEDLKNMLSSEFSLEDEDSVVLIPGQNNELLLQYDCGDPNYQVIKGIPLSVEMASAEGETEQQPEQGTEQTTEQDTEQEQQNSHISGGVTWAIVGDTLTISPVSGTNGEMPDYTPENISPWEQDAAMSNVKQIVIASGVKSLGQYAFTMFTTADKLTVAGTVGTIPTNFCWNAKISTIELNEGTAIIEEEAFMNGKHYVAYIPKSVKEISLNAFQSVADGVFTFLHTVYGYSNTEADTYVKSLNEQGDGKEYPQVYDDNWNQIAMKFVDRDLVALSQQPSRKVTISFYAYENWPAFYSYSVMTGTKLGTLPELVKGGYLLKGWYTSPYGGTRFTTDTIIRDEMSLYAQWQKLSVKATSIRTGIGIKKGLKLTWKKVSAADGYEIRYSTRKSMKKSKKADVTGTKKTIKKLKSKKTYYVQIRAYAEDSAGEEVYSAWSKAKKIKTK